jgi:hypothetical protein
MRDERIVKIFAESQQVDGRQCPSRRQSKEAESGNASRPMKKGRAASHAGVRFLAHAAI